MFAVILVFLLLIGFGNSPLLLAVSFIKVFCSVFVPICFYHCGTNPSRITDTIASVLYLVLATDFRLASSVTHLAGVSDHSILHFNVGTLFSMFFKYTYEIFSRLQQLNFDQTKNELAGFLEFLLAFFEPSVKTNWTMFRKKKSKLSNGHVCSA